MPWLPLRLAGRMGMRIITPPKMVINDFTFSKKRRRQNGAAKKHYLTHNLYERKAAAGAIIIYLREGRGEKLFRLRACCACCSGLSPRKPRAPRVYPAACGGDSSPPPRPSAPLVTVTRMGLFTIRCGLLLLCACCPPAAPWRPHDGESSRAPPRLLANAAAVVAEAPRVGLRLRAASALGRSAVSRLSSACASSSVFEGRSILRSAAALR